MCVTSRHSFKPSFVDLYVKFIYIFAAYCYNNISPQEHGQKTLDDWRLTRVSGQFRVIALGLPVPPYHGNALDPPLRSRFQSRNVAHLPFHVRIYDHNYDDLCDY